MLSESRLPKYFETQQKNHENASDDFCDTRFVGVDEVRKHTGERGTL